MVPEAEFKKAIQAYWDARSGNAQKQANKGIKDAGTRSEATGGAQMGALEGLTVNALKSLGLKSLEVHTSKNLELPGFFRPEKKWDLVALSRGQLVCALEFKSQVGPSFGNNFNNRSEEAIGNAVDIWTAFREGRFGNAPRPFLGYFFLLEDCPRVHTPVKLQEPHFKADEIFSGASYAKRYELLCRRLILERHYDAACLTLASKGRKSSVSFPAADLSYDRLLRELLASASKFA